MSTRSMIAQTQYNGTVRAVYCHCDGYPEHNGRLLTKHWSNPVDLAELIDRGDMSSLGESIQLTRFYAWSGEDHAYLMAAQYRDYEHMLTTIGDDIEYVYVMLRTGKWAMADVASGHARPLSDVMAEINRKAMYVV